MNEVVFRLDVDNTLIDNDAVAADLRAHLVAQFGNSAEHYWEHFEAVRAESAMPTTSVRCSAAAATSNSEKPPRIGCSRSRVT